MRHSLALLALVASSAGCLLPATPSQPNQGTIVQDTQDPFGYRSALPRDVHATVRQFPEARGRACRTVLSWPPNPPTPFLGSGEVAGMIPWPSSGVAFGNEGLIKATREAEKDGGGGTLFDVRADLHTTAFLGILRFECVEVHALVAR